MVDAGREKERKVNDAMKAQEMPATVMPLGRSAGRVALALGAFFAAVFSGRSPRRLGKASTSRTWNRT